MSGKTVSSAILVLLLANLAATICDVLIKLAGPDIAIFQFTFARVVFMCLILLPFVAKDLWRKPLAGMGVHFLRGNIWVLTAVLLVISLANMPIATANAIFYTCPILIMLLAAVVYRETLSKSVIIAGVSGFAGIVVILKPEYLGWPVVSALGFALFLAVNSLLVRKLPQGQGALHGLFLSQMCALPVAGVLAYWEGGSLTQMQLGLGLGSAMCSVLYSLGCVIGYRFVASSQVSSAEYSGLLFAVLAGWTLFGETPDWSLLLGAVLIIGPLVWIATKDRKARRRALVHHEEALL